MFCDRLYTQPLAKPQAWCSIPFWQRSASEMGEFQMQEHTTLSMRSELIIWHSPKRKAPEICQKRNRGKKNKPKPKPHLPHSTLDTAFCRTKTCGYKGNNLEKGNTSFWTLFQMQFHILAFVFPYCTILASYSIIHKYWKDTIFPWN